MIILLFFFVLFGFVCVFLFHAEDGIRGKATCLEFSRVLFRSPDGVLAPEVNIRLGSSYLGELIDRYSGNRLAAAAAYNAGPGRVDRWLRDAPEEFDLFVESIPFRETRNYVPADRTSVVQGQRGGVRGRGNR